MQCSFALQTANKPKTFILTLIYTCTVLVINFMNMHTIVQSIHQLVPNIQTDRQTHTHTQTNPPANTFTQEQ